MAKPEWGTKRTCQNCGALFYDLRRTPVACPSCGTPFDGEQVIRMRRRPAPALKDKAPAVEEAEEALEIDEDAIEEIDETEDEDVLEDASDLGDDDEIDVIKKGEGEGED